MDRDDLAPGAGADAAAAPARLFSKVLVLDACPVAQERLRAFCEDHGLVGLKVHGDSVLSVLRSNVDLGGVFLAEDFASSEGTGAALAATIQSLRPELPVFLRRADDAPPLPLEGLPGVRLAWTTSTLDELAPVLDQVIFSITYPAALVRGICEISLQALANQFPHAVVSHDPPCVVHDRIIHGELFTLIPIESSWCRGYMTLQTTEAAMQRLLGITDGDADFRDLHHALGESTNLIWGAFKNRWIDEGAPAGRLTQVPIVINHAHSYISFGSPDPQLCIRYTLADPAHPGAEPVPLWQRFVFHLDWSPERFRENECAVASLVSAGELELF